MCVNHLASTKIMEIMLMQQFCQLSVKAYGPLVIILLVYLESLVCSLIANDVVQSNS